MKMKSLIVPPTFLIPREVGPCPPYSDLGPLVKPQNGAFSGGKQKVELPIMT